MHERVNHNPSLDLVYSQRDEVAAIFEDIVPRGELGKVDRGGSIHSNKKVRLGFEKIKNPNFHVESSFGNEQQQYVTVVLACLNTLARGRRIDNVEVNKITFKGRILGELEAKTTDSFPDAIKYASYGLLKDFAEEYLNLTPALAGMFKVGGAEGINAVINAFRTLLTAENFSIEMIDELLEMKDSNPHNHERFTRKHPYHISIYKDEYEPRRSRYEVWCSGEGFARELLNQSKEALIEHSNSGGMTFSATGPDYHDFKNIAAYVDILNNRANKI